MGCELSWKWDFITGGSTRLTGCNANVIGLSCTNIVFLGDGVTPTALLVADLDVRIQCRKIRIRIESQVAETSLGVSLWTRVQIIVMDP